eukprot:COSAG01_NODE_2829_length_6998_cov_487.185824_3_plen_101_part_00
MQYPTASSPHLPLHVRHDLLPDPGHLLPPRRYHATALSQPRARRARASANLPICRLEIDYLLSASWHLLTGNVLRPSAWNGATAVDTTSRVAIYHDKKEQ